MADADLGEIQHPLGQRRKELRAGRTAAPPPRGRLGRSVRPAGLILQMAFACHGSALPSFAQT
jgi:hypothetical protein